MSPDTQASAQRSFAVVHTWPEMKNAEYEVIQRIVRAGANIGANVFIVDNDGYPLWASHQFVSKASPRLTNRDCEFAISLHFESPKLFDVYSYITLWNPPSFFDIFEYKAATRKLATHDDALSCDSEVADAHAANLFEGLGRPLELPLPRLFHSLPNPYLKANISENARLFYIGINWERISGQKGRHHELLKQLDAADLIDIYGPTKFQGVRPWKGYRNYRGSIPFDGRSILSSINRSGICLAFSSKEHQTSGIMSNRLFEGLAAGAAVIANPHPIIEKYFKDCVYVVDDSKPADEVAHDVLEIVYDIRKNPDEALARVAIGQERLKKDFSLEVSLEKLFALHEVRRAAARGHAIIESSHADILAVYDGVDVAELHEMIMQIDRQRGVVANVIIVCDRSFADIHAAEINQRWGRSRNLRFVTGHIYVPLPTTSGQTRRSGTCGRLVAEALRHVASPFFCILGPKEIWFEDHLRSLLVALRRDSSAFMAVSGTISETRDADGRSRRAMGELVFAESGRILRGVGVTGGAGRFLFKKDILARLPPSVLPCLDGIEVRAICLWAYINGSIAQSMSATYVYQSHAVAEMSDLIAEHLQIKMLLDSVQNSARWQELSASQPAGDVSRQSRIIPLEVNRPYVLQADGDGCDLIVSGFSQPEKDHVWIDGHEGVLRFRLTDSYFISHQLLVLTVMARNARADGQQQLCTISMNDEIALEDLPVGEEPEDIHIAFGDQGRLANGDLVTLSIKLRHAEKVYDQSGRVEDPRRLGLCVKSVRIERFDRPATAPVLQVASELQLVTGGNGAACVVSGLSLERNLCWINGTNGRLKFRIAAPLPDKATLGLYVTARHSEAGEPQSCDVYLNGKVILESANVEEAPHWLDIPLEGCDSLRYSAVNFLDIKVTGHAHQVIDAGGVVIDPRRLGMSIDRLRLNKDDTTEDERGREDAPSPNRSRWAWGRK